MICFANKGPVYNNMKHNMEKLNQLKPGDTVYCVETFVGEENSTHAYDDLGPTEKGAVKWLCGECVERTYLGEVQDGIVTVPHIAHLLKKRDFSVIMDDLRLNIPIDDQQLSLHCKNQVFSSQEDAQKYIEFISGKSEDCTLRTWGRLMQNRKRGNVLTMEEEEQLEKLGYSAIFVNNEGVIELHGLMTGELSISDIGPDVVERFYIDAGTSFDGNRPFIEVRRPKVNKNALLSRDYTWRLSTNFPYATFDVFDDETSDESRKARDTGCKELNALIKAISGLEDDALYCEALLIKTDVFEN